LLSEGRSPPRPFKRRPGDQPRGSAAPAPATNEKGISVSAHEWERRTQNQAAQGRASPASSELELRRRAVGKKLDALGPEFRLSQQKQARLKELLGRKAALTPSERGELEILVQEADEITLRRAEALDRVV
jgi:hypothetical protein